MIHSPDPNVTASDAAGSTDAVVVGAGPAGAATALLLARAGREVVLTDRAAFPRAKPCGDCLSAGATRVLERLGVLDTIRSEHPARLEGWTIVAPDGSAFTGRFGPPTDDHHPTHALSLARDRLDHALVGAARAAGARMLAGVRITDVLRDGRGTAAGVLGRDADGRMVRISARLVVGADGLRSIVARRLGLVGRGPRTRKLSLTAHVRGVPPLDGRGEMHLADGACAGLAPVQSSADPVCNLTLVLDSDRFGREVADDATACFWSHLQRFPRLRGRLGRATLVGPGTHPDTSEPTLPFLASGPFDRPTRAVVAPGAALVGDAAGYYDPFTGQGIYRALRGAEILADEADRALRRSAPPLLRHYARRRAHLLRGTRTLQRLIEFVTARPVLANHAIRRIGRSAAIADAIVAVTGDVRRTRSLLSPALLTTFILDRTRAEG